MSDMEGFNNESSNESYTYSIPPDLTHSMDSNYRGSLPLHRTIIRDSGHASIDSNNIHFYQPSSQVIFPSDTTSLNYNGVYTDGNKPLNTAYFQNSGNRVNYPKINYNLNDRNAPFVSYPTPQTLVHTPSTSVFQTNYDSNNYGEPSISCSFPQTSGQTQSTSSFSNNASMMTIATSHGQAVIIMNGDVDLERLLIFIQSCGRVERLYR